MSELSHDQMPQGWSSIASAYERAFEQITSQFSHEALRQLKLEPGERVLDVATGTGSFSMPAARAGADVLATDFAPGMIERLRQRIQQEGLHNIRAEVMDGQALNVADASCDVSASIVGVIFFPDIARGIAELKRVLKPGGRCAIVCWGDPETLQLMQYLTQAIATAVPDFEIPTQTPVWARLLGHELLEQSMRDAGFVDVRVTNMYGRLEMESPQNFWNDFVSSSPPLIKLFEQLGEDNTRITGEIFAELVTENSKHDTPCMTAEACIGIGYA